MCRALDSQREDTWGGAAVARPNRMNHKRKTAEVPELDEQTLEIAEAFAAEQHGADKRFDEAPIAEAVTAPGDPQIAGGDVDVSADDAAHVGEAAPGMGNPSPDQDDVTEIGRATGIVFNDDEPIDIERKLTRRDDERWELDPASSEDYPARERPRRKPEKETS
jgi:hypothetical protein